MYNIEIAPAAERDLKKLNKKLSSLGDIVNVIDNLSFNPRPLGVRKIKGFINTFRIRIHSYRIIYDIYEKNNKVVILRIVKRSESTYKFI